MTSLCNRQTLAGFCRTCKQSNKKLIFETIFQFQNNFKGNFLKLFSTLWSSTTNSAQSIFARYLPVRQAIDQFHMPSFTSDTARQIKNKMTKTGRKDQLTTSPAASVPPWSWCCSAGRCYGLTGHLWLNGGESCYLGRIVLQNWMIVQNQCFI